MNARNLHKIIGAILLAFGVVLLIRGHDIAQSVDSQVKLLFTGSSSKEVMYYYIGSAICFAVGLAEAFWSSRK